jgi:fructokinase
MSGGGLGSPSKPRKPRIVSWGELLWDLYPEGRHLGGSAANVAYHAALLGAESRLVSRVGRDELAGPALALLEAAGVNVDDVSTDEDLPTGHVTIVMEGQNPRFLIEDRIACDHIVATEETIEQVMGADVLCFSTLAQRTEVMRSRLDAMLRRIGRSRPPCRFAGARTAGPLRFLDLNLRPPFTDPEIIFDAIERADLLKLNEEEFAWVARAYGEKDPIRFLFAHTDLRAIIVTRAERGAEIYGRHVFCEIAGLETREGDPVGAGDSFVAAFSCSVARGATLPRALSDANRHAAWVAGEIGAMPSPEGLRLVRYGSPRSRTQP